MDKNLKKKSKNTTKIKKINKTNPPKNQNKKKIKIQKYKKYTGNGHYEQELEGRAAT